MKVILNKLLLSLLTFGVVLIAGCAAEAGVGVY
jgi:hypothetical protein